MRARLGLWMWTLAGLGLAPGCARENPAFDATDETLGSLEGGDAGGESSDDGTPQTSGAPSETGDEGGEVCELGGGVDMNIKVPQPCGETNLGLDAYEHYFNVVEAAGSSWQVQFCSEGCGECEPLAAALTFAPLPVAELAGPDTCLKLTARRLGTGDDCSYDAALVQDMSNNGEVLILARRTELLEIPEPPTTTGLVGFEPLLTVDESCDCAETPEACCEGQAPTLFAYDIGDQEVRVGETKTVAVAGRSFEFWAFDAFQPGDCGAGLNLVWALTVPG